MAIAAPFVRLNVHPLAGRRHVRAKAKSRSWRRERGASFSGKAFLLCRPCRCGMRGDSHMDNSSEVVGEDDKDEEQPDVTMGTTNGSTAMIWLT
jgi:hypothetical protein